MGKSKRVKQNSKTGKFKTDKSFTWWHIAPFVIFFVGIIYAALVAGGETIFVSLGWNTSIISVIKLLGLIVLTLFYLAIFSFLIYWYVYCVKAWKNKERLTPLPKRAEYTFLTIILVGSSIFFLWRAVITLF